MMEKNKKQLDIRDCGTWCLYTCILTLSSISILSISINALLEASDENSLYLETISQCLFYPFLSLIFSICLLLFLVYCLRRKIFRVRQARIIQGKWKWKENILKFRIIKMVCYVLCLAALYLYFNLKEIQPCENIKTLGEINDKLTPPQTIQKLQKIEKLYNCSGWCLSNPKKTLSLNKSLNNITSEPCYNKFWIEFDQGNRSEVRKNILIMFFLTLSVLITTRLRYDELDKQQKMIQLKRIQRQIPIQIE